MKSLHREDLFGWSVFDTSRNLDFNSVVWVRPEGNIVIDPVPLTEHDAAHLRALGGADWIVVTNSDHVRATRELAAWTGASIAGPAAEQQGFPVECECWLADGELLVPGLIALEMQGSKSPGELALVLQHTTLVVGDLVRGPRGGRLDLLASQRLADPAAARASVWRLADIGIEAVLCGDGWHAFNEGGERLRELAQSLGE